MSSQSQTVMIGTTLNPAGDKLVASGVRLARSMGARIHLVHAYQMPKVQGGGVGFEFPSAGDVLPVGESLGLGWRELRERMDLQIARLGIRREEIAGTTLDLGTPHLVLIAAARRIDPDLVVLGAVESGEAFSRLLGSTADRVVRKSDRPVLLVRDELTVPLARVLLPVGLSERSTEALYEGLELLGGMAEHGAEVEALFVSAEVNGRPARGQSVPEPVRAAATGRLDSFLAEARGAAGWRIGSRVEFGFIDREILNRIESWQPNLVVVRSHDRAGIEPFLLGPVTMSLMRQDRASILVIPPVAARASRAVPAVRTERALETVSIAA